MGVERIRVDGCGKRLEKLLNLERKSLRMVERRWSVWVDEWRKLNEVSDGVGSNDIVGVRVTKKRPLWVDGSELTMWKKKP